ncbi:MAG: hypothetical protein IJ515_02100 [Clostridia bacterium]|nr:hypothetical protein [Clostridia bacterium]
MKYTDFVLSKGTQATVETEILYNVASARVNQFEILKLLPSAGDGERALTAAVKVLKGLKRQGRIRLFILSENLFSDTTEAEYLRNKYPDIAQILADKEKSIIVMI